MRMKPEVGEPVANEQARPLWTASCGSGGRALWEDWEREISSWPPASPR